LIYRLCLFFDKLSSTLTWIAMGTSPPKNCTLLCKNWATMSPNTRLKRWSLSPTWITMAKSILMVTIVNLWFLNISFIDKFCYALYLFCRIQAYDLPQRAYQPPHLKILQKCKHLMINRINVVYILYAI